MTKKQIEELVKSVGDTFRTFGGGNYSNMQNNPIAYALKDKPLQFAAGVDVKDVVTHVLKSAKKIAFKKKKP